MLLVLLRPSIRPSTRPSVRGHQPKYLHMKFVYEKLANGRRRLLHEMAKEPVRHALWVALTVSITCWRTSDTDDNGPRRRLLLWWAIHHTTQSKGVYSQRSHFSRGGCSAEEEEEEEEDVTVSWVLYWWLLQNLWDYVTRMHIATFVVVIFLRSSSSWPCCMCCNCGAVRVEWSVESLSVCYSR